MEYKSLFTVLLDEERAGATLDAAIALADRWGAHLDVLCFGLHPVDPAGYSVGAITMIDESILGEAEAQAGRLRDMAEKRLKRSGISYGIEPAIAFPGGVTHWVASRARFADLTILGRPADQSRPREAEAILEAALFNGHVPVLMVPGGSVDGLLDRVLLGWNDSDEALEAARAARPLLVAAGQVEVAVIDPPDYGGDGLDPGSRLAESLAHHGARVELAEVARTLPKTAEVILRRARDTGASLLVVGAYGHSRLRESIMGGVTRDLLDDSELPLFMAH